MNEGDWKQDELDLLRRLWAEGVKAAELSARLHRTKNSLIGKAHRLGLPARPSPIRPRRDGQPSRRRVAKPPPPKPAAVAPAPAPDGRKFQPARAVVVPPAPRPAPVAPTPPVAAPTACTTPPEFVYAEGGRGCAWVERPWRVGDQPAANTCGKPRRDARCSYCQKHADIVFQHRTREISEDAALWK